MVVGTSEYREMSFKVKCFEPALPIKICEGGWQVPEVLRSYEECEDIVDLGRFM